MEKGYLVLADGQVFEGARFGASLETVGELVFTTNMCGYIETLTDPSYYGQIIMQTFPLIGNYGFIGADAESGGCAARGYVVREWCEHPSNFRCEGTVDDWLRAHGTAGLCGVDTRAITRIIRAAGVMNAAITSDPTPALIEGLKEYRITAALDAVTAQAPYTLAAQGSERFRVVLLDYGAKANIARCLTARGCAVTVMPAGATAQQVLAQKPDGVMLSNGPGDPADNAGCIATLAALAGKVPMFGICLGHQLLALALGAKTEKLKYGHRGANQPVRDMESGRVYITSQNHGYAVSADSLPDGARLRFVNANDGTVEGLDWPAARAFSVQFHPEAAAGPRDCEGIFDRFIGLMEEK